VSMDIESVGGICWTSGSCLPCVKYGVEGSVGRGNSSRKGVSECNGVSEFKMETWLLTWLDVCLTCEVGPASVETEERSC
jgi:hypothetical protein